MDPALSVLRFLAVGGRHGDALVIDGTTCSGAMAEILTPLLDCKLVAHDGVQVWKNIAEHVGLPVTAIESTQLMWNAMTSETVSVNCKDPTNAKLQALSLESVLSRGIDVDITPKQKQSRRGRETPDPEQLARAGTEVLHLVRLHDTLLNRLRIRGVEQVYARMAKAVRAIVLLESCGMNFSVDRHAALVADWRRQLDTARAELPQGMDLHKPKGRDAVLREILPSAVVEHWPRVHGDLLSSSKEAMGAFPEIGVLAKLKAWKTLDKLVSTYGESFAAFVGPDGRIRSTYSLAGTKSGRLSSHDPALQNIPRMAEFRSLFTTPDEETVLVVADMSQAELRCFACLSHDRKMCAAYDEGLDLHRMTASQLLGVPPEQIDKQDRTWGRVVNLALGYGQSAAGFRKYAKQEQGLIFSQEEAEQIRRNYLETYPKLHEFQRAMIRKARMQGCVSTPGGRVRRFEPGDRKAFTAAINHPCQGALAEVFLHILSMLTDRLDGLGKLVNVVHDEVVVECPSAASAEVVRIVEETMADGFRAVFPGQGCTQGLTEAKVCRTWAEAK